PDGGGDRGERAIGDRRLDDEEQPDVRRRRPVHGEGGSARWWRGTQARTVEGGSTEAARFDDFRPPTHGSRLRCDNPS
ncbi:hypothetical protein Dimus_008664, partial [Dionaea muscipula]